eukprot:RCo052361
MAVDCCAAVAWALKLELRRALSKEEKALLAMLSPEGIAKINVDLDRGIGAGKTLDELWVASAHLKQRRALLETQMSPTAKKVAGQLLRRPLTTDELALLVEGSPEVVLEALQARCSTAGESMDDVLEELASEHKYEALRRDALLCSDRLRQDVNIRALAPIESVPGKYVSGLNCLRLSRGSAVVCPSAAAAWFQEKQPAVRSEDGGDSSPGRRALDGSATSPRESDSASPRVPRPPSDGALSSGRYVRSVSFPQVQRGPAPHPPPGSSSLPQIRRATVFSAHSPSYGDGTLRSLGSPGAASLPAVSRAATENRRLR